MVINVAKAFHFGVNPCVRLWSNCDAVARNCDKKITATLNCVAVFCNYGSQCDRSYGVTVSQLRVTTIKKSQLLKNMR